MILVTCILLRMRGRPSRDAWILLAATSVWRGMRVAIVSSNLVGGDVANPQGRDSAVSQLWNKAGLSPCSNFSLFPAVTQRMPRSTTASHKT